MLANIDEREIADALAIAQGWAVGRPIGTDWRALDPTLWANIAARYNDDGSLVLLSYTDRAQHEGRWTPLERICRGLILDTRDGAVVARPWPKFFNWGELDPQEQGRLQDVALLRVSEKLDGSLIILFHFAGRWRAATRGSFTSPQARHAQALIDGDRYRLAHLPRVGWTYLCELITPANRVVIDYGQRDELVLLDIVHSETGVALSPTRVRGTVLDVGFGEVGILDNAALDTLPRALQEGRGVEGWVASFVDNTMVKFKTGWYMELHKLVSGFNPERVREAMLQRRVHEYRATLPEEFWPDFDRWLVEIGARLDRRATDLADRYTDTLALAHAHGGARKHFADLVMATVDPASRWALFMLYDGKQIEDRLLAKLDLTELGVRAYDTWKGDTDGTQGGGDEQPDLGAGKS